MDVSTMTDIRSAPSPEPTTGSEGADWAAGVLRSHGMPAAEIHALLATEDRRTIRRHLELHRERLAERLDDQFRILTIVEDVLMGGRTGVSPAAGCPR
jgi:hypothetical protein